MRVLVALLVLVPLAEATSSRAPIKVQAAADGTGAVGEPIRLRLTWHVSPNLDPPEANASLDVPDWVSVEGPARWTLRSERDRATSQASEVVLTPQREGYWRAVVRTDGSFLTGRHVLAVRSFPGDGAVAREPEEVLPARDARVEAALGEWNATHAEVIVRGAKGDGWQAPERLALAPAGQGHVSTLAGDEGEHRERFGLPEGVGLSFVATAYVEVAFDVIARRRPVAEACHVLARSAGNVTLEGGPCRRPVPAGAWVPLAALAAASMAVRPSGAASARAPAWAGAWRRASRTGGP